MRTGRSRSAAAVISRALPAFPRSSFVPSAECYSCFGAVQLLGRDGRVRYVPPMCGRVRLSAYVSEIQIAFRIPPEGPAPNFPPGWNVAPTDSLPIVRFNPKDQQRSLDVMRWGPIPYWAKDIKVGFANINAK